MLHALRAWGDKWPSTHRPSGWNTTATRACIRAICATCGERVRGDDLQYISTVPDWDIPGLMRRAEQAARAAANSHR